MTPHYDVIAFFLLVLLFVLSVIVNLGLTFIVLKLYTEFAKQRMQEARSERQ